MTKADSTNQDSLNNSAEFLTIETIDIKTITETIEKTHELMSKVLRIPTNTIILNFEIFTRHPFGGSVREREAQPFVNALLSVSKFIYFLNKLVENQQNIKKYSDQVRSLLHDDWDNCNHCIQLQHIMKAAFGIVSEDDEFLDSSFQPKYISFLADNFLLQSGLCSCRFYQNLLTAIGNIFVIIPVKKYQNRINAFRDNERNSTPNDEHSADYQSFLHLVRNISKLRGNNSDFAYTFHRVGNIFVHYATDFSSKPLFVIYIDTLAALTKNRALAEEFYKRLNESLSDTINSKHLIDAFSGYADDFQNNELSQQRLDFYDASSLEVILHLLSGFFTYSKTIRDDIIDNSSGRYNYPQGGFISALFNLLVSSIPASLKATIFDTFSSICVDTKRAEYIWQQLEGSQILTKEFVENGQGGIIMDIDVVETNAKTFPLLSSFISFIASFLRSNPSIEIIESGGNYFKLYHRFLMEQGLLKLKSRIFFHFHEKWSILSKICQAWTDLMNYSAYIKNKEVSFCLMQTALCDSRFIGELISLINEEDIPEQSLFCIFRLLLLIIENESEFLKTMDPSDRIFYTPITKRFSWSSSALVKLIQCVASDDYDLQLETLNLAQHLAKDSPDITQIVFSRLQARTIASFIRVINFDDNEVGQIETGERNVRNTLLEFLISLGSSSYFVRYVCNFDMMDPPKSICNSTLAKGILPEILKVMKEKKAAKEYPIFAANSLKLLLMICDGNLTSRPLLNLLRTSSHSFFNEQFRMLQDKRCSLTAIGCYLQLLAREATDSMHDSYSSTTLQTFRILMDTNGFREQSRSRIVLYDEFIDRINDGEEAICVACGIREATDAYIKSTSALKAMHENQGHWSKIWSQFLIHLLVKISKLRNSTSIKYLSEAVSFITNFLFCKKALDEITADDRRSILTTACEALNLLSRNIHSRDPKLDIYTIFHSMKLDDIQDKYRKYEPYLIRNHLANDLNGNTPVLKASVYAAAEAIIPIASVEIFRKEFIINAINSIQTQSQSGMNSFSEKDQNPSLRQNEYDYFVENPAASLMIAARYSFFIRLLVLKPAEYRSCLIDNNLITKIAGEPFWDNIRECFFTSTQYPVSETYLQVASKALYVMTNLCICAPDNEMMKEEISEFYLKYSEDQFQPIFHFPETLTINALKFLIDLSRFFLFVPDPVAEREDLKEMIADIKKQISDNSEKIKGKIRCCGDKMYSKPPLKVLREAEEIINEFTKYCS